MRTSDFDYPLPLGLIAQTPTEPRDRSRLMVLNRSSGQIEHRRFHHVADYLGRGDILVLNDSRVIPARLHGRKASGGRVELLLLRRISGGIWETLARPGRRLPPGTRVELDEGLVAEVEAKGEGGTFTVRFSDEAVLEQVGSVPLPPYIHTPLEDAERYQTVYSTAKGSVAAPTAGLHFTPRLLEKLEQSGVGLAFVTLHVGLDSFRPVQEEDPTHHPMHREYCELSPEVAAELNRAREEGRRVVAVGTTTARVLEEAGRGRDEVQPVRGWTDLFILPGFQFRVVNALITNFHLPRSTLLMLVSAFAGRELVLKAYAEAIEKGYRFYSFGDCMLIL